MIYNLKLVAKFVFILISLAIVPFSVATTYLSYLHLYVPYSRKAEKYHCDLHYEIAIYVCFGTFMSIMPKYLCLHTCIYLCSVDMHIESSYNILTNIYLYQYIFLSVTFMLITPDTFVLETLSFAHITTNILYIY